MREREVFFGFDNFFVAYAGNVFKPVEYMAAMLLMVGVISALGSLLLATFCESFRREPEQSSATLSVCCVRKRPCQERNRELFAACFWVRVRGFLFKLP